jgi:hypothetical protein
VAISPVPVNSVPPEEDRVRRTLAALIELLEGTEEPYPEYAEGLRRLDLMVEEAHDRGTPDLLQQAVRTIIRLYGGMGGFNDLVLMKGRRVLPQMEEFHRLRHELFEAARDELR